EDIVEDARAREREIRLGAEDYADEILNTLEANLSKFIAAVQRGRERLAGKDEPAEVGGALEHTHASHAHEHGAGHTQTQGHAHAARHAHDRADAPRQGRP